MGRTAGIWEQDTPNNDGQLFVGANGIDALVAASAPLASAGAGLFTLNVPVSTTANLFVQMGEMIRTGVLATANLRQQQFGTKASVPGPSSVVNTGEPLGMVGRPPFLGAKTPTLPGGQLRGAVPKGVQINYVDVVMGIFGANLTSATFGLTQTTFPAVGAAAAAPVVTNIIALGANGIPLVFAAAGTAVRTRIPVAVPAFTVLDTAEIIANLNIVAPAGSTASVYGLIFGLSFNYN